MLAGSDGVYFCIRKTVLKTKWIPNSSENINDLRLWKPSNNRLLSHNLANLKNYSYTPQSANNKVVQVTKDIHDKMRNMIPERYKYIVQASMMKPLTIDTKSGAVTDVCCRTCFLWRNETDGWDRGFDFDPGFYTVFEYFSCPILKSEYIIKKDKMVVIVTCFCIYLE